MVYVRFHPVAAMTLIVARLLRIPTVVEVNGTPEDLFSVYPELRPVASGLRWCGRLALRKANGVIAVSEGLAEWVRREAEDACVTVVPNAANPELFKPAERETAQPYVCFVGGLSPWQGLDVLLEAVSAPRWPTGVSVRIAGDGPWRARVEAADKTNEGIRYHGVLPYEEVGDLVAGALAAVSLKTGDAWHASPLKVFEAMAAGVPVIVTDQPTQAAIVQDAGCGLVVPPGDSEAVANAVRHLYEDEGLRRELAINGHRAASTEHTWDQRAAATADFLTEVLDSSASSPTGEGPG